MGVHYHKLNAVIDGLVFKADAGNKLCDNVTNVRNVITPTQTGTFVNGASTVNDAYLLDGVDDRIEWGDVNSFAPNNPFSIGAWINMDNNDKFRICSKGVSFSSGEYLFSTNATGKLVVLLYDDTVNINNWIAGVTSAVLSINTWYYVAFTYNGNGSTTGIKMYVNAVEDTTTATSGSYTAMNHSAANIFKIGTGAETISHADGEIRYVDVSNKVLTLSELERNYQSQKGRFD